MANDAEPDTAATLIVQPANIPTLTTKVAATPALISQCGPAAQFAWEDFIYGKLRNPHTRRNYQYAVRRFLAWCEPRQIELVRVMPRDVGQYLDSVHFAPATKSLHLAALRHFFDELVTRHVVLLNPAAAVRGERHQVIEGKTPEIPVKQARELLASINTSHVIGLRDRAAISVLIYTAARVGAVSGLRRQDFVDVGDQYCLRFTDKGGKSREIPVRHDLQQFLFDYLDAGGLRDAEPASGLFRTTVRKSRQLTDRGMTPHDISRMVKRRIRDAGLPKRLSPHSFRVYVAAVVMWRPIRFCWSDPRFRAILRHISEPTRFPS